MNRHRGAVGALLLAAACWAPPARPGATGATGAAPPAVARLPVRVDFVPPLRTPGAVWFACENGFSGSVAAPCSGVDLRLPPGPATLTLKTEGAARELVVVVVPGMPPVRWRLGPPPRRSAAAGNVPPGVASRPAPR